MPNGGPEQRKLTAILFTDIVGSTQLKHDLGDREAVPLIKRHHALIREILSGFIEGEEIETAGDSFLMVFNKPSDAVRFALMVQAKLRAFGQAHHPISDRIGIHVGEVSFDCHTNPGGRKALSGIHVDTCARVMSLGQGNQILMTRFAFDSARSVLKGDEIEGVGPLSWLNHGPYEVKGVEDPLEICEVGEMGCGVLSSPLTSEKAHRHVSLNDEPVLGWRPALDQVVPSTQWILERKLGEGGFGEVWLGRHETLKEKRVFKFCFRADRVRSLKREVTLFRLMKDKVGQHPNIVGIQEVFFDTPPFYIVMDYAEATDLRAWCEREGFGNISLEMRLEIVAQVAAALQAAHEAGVLHRDVKPSNILVSSGRSEVGGQKTAPSSLRSAAAKRSDDAALASGGGVSTGSVTSASAAKAGSALADSLCPRTPQEGVLVKLTDFGIGQVVSEEALAGMTRLGFTETMMSPGSSSQSGTHLFMAPELLAGQPATIRSDIYSLGVVLYQLLAGDFNRPLTTDWARTIHDPLLRADLEKCFAGDPQERFADAGQLARNLRSMGERQAALGAQNKAAALRKLVRRTAAALATIGAVSLLVLFAFKQGGAKGSEAPPAKLAVLPLAIFSGDVAQEYFADEMTDDLIGKLGQISALRVIGRSSVIQYKKATNLAEVARQLHVDAVVQGTLKREQGKVQLAVRLFKGPSARPLWSTTYERELRDVFALQNEMALAVASQMKLKVLPGEQARLSNAPQVDPEALNLYYRGKASALADGDVNNQEEIRLYQGAVEISKDLAPAWAALAGAYLSRSFYYEPQKYRELEVKAQTAVLNALELDPNLAEAYVQHGRLYWNPGNYFQHEKALNLFYRALKLNPSSGEALKWIGAVFAHAGFFDEFEAKVKESVALDPLGRGMKQAYSLLWNGEYKQSILLWSNTNQDGRSTASFGSHWAWALFADHQTNAAQAKLQEYLSRKNADPPGELTAMNAVLLAASGDEAGSIEQIKIAQKKTETSFGDTHHAAYFITCAYARLNKTPEALQWLKITAETGFPCYPLFRSDPNLNTLRTDARFIAFLQKQETDWKKRKVDWAKLEDGRKVPRTPP